MRILVIEDNRDILANVLDYLELKGFVVDCAQDGLSGLHLAATAHYDLIVLDIMLPGIDGYQVCKRLREDAGRDTPIIMLTARDALDDRLQGLKSGADDYLIKPFALSELVARIEAVLRRSQGARKQKLQVGDLQYDLDTLQATRAGQSLRLNPIGHKLLTVLMQKSPAVVRREQLEEALWGDDVPDSDSLRSHIHQLRQVLDKPFDKPLLHTVHGVGFRLAELDHAD
ncbi:response regulator transcription factor [Stutzerimonas stutzeri]|uniref:response regulator transcription factor n=1 Tax=Stutzerimonas TaxID=2901164 RepID=UPI000397E1EC|nr:response regulator transcription factor [Stutzerimonas stutzeri]EQM72499.1 XRE family transcriptional regulator [Stutzerimonas stutzeri MF28]MCI0919659.1 response regulator transcription factor [Stutzerimonas stutzeri]PNG12705.1 DNA-binding response regulator [Stutzerimonas stutzeri]QUE76615.1 response regulator transcription factor [Stutzerimonas stutzeri]